MQRYFILVALLLIGTSSIKLAAEDRNTNEKDITKKVIELNPVVITGTGTHQRLKNTPVPVSVITANEIKRTGISNFQEALTMMVPSLSFRPNSMGTYLMMNGLSNKYVLILVNGRKVTGDISGNIDLNQIDMTRIKRIEVLNGAASSLYGSDAIGGVINIITNEPKDAVSFSSNSSYQKKNQFTQGLNLDLNQKGLGSYTSYRYEHSDGWQNNNKTMDGSNEIETLAPLSTGFTSNNLSQKFTYDATSNLSFYANGGYYNKLLDRPVSRESVKGGSDYNTAYEAFNWGAGSKYKISQRNVISLDYSGNDYRSRYKYMIQKGDLLPGDYSLTKIQKYNDAELKGVFGFTENSTTVFGLNYRNEVLKRPDSDLDKSVDTKSAFGQHEVKLLNHFTGILGLRYDYHEQTGGRFTPKVTAMYNMGNLNIRANYSSGFRSPGIDELYYRMFKKMGSKYIVSYGNKDLKPEYSNYYSLNLEYNTRGLSASVTGYLNYVKNMITSSSTKFDELPMETQTSLRNEIPEINDLSSTKNLSIKNYLNFQKATIKGFEANANINPFDGVTLGANYSFAYGQGLNSSNQWQKIERSIRHTATVTANYSHLWNDYGLNVNINGRMQSKVYYPGDVDGNAPGYGVWNINTRHTFDGFRNFIVEPGIGIDNIFNKVDNRTLEKNFALYSPGRTLVISLALKIK